MSLDDEQEASNDLATLMHNLTTLIMNERVRAYNDGIDAERARCLAIVGQRLKLWNDAAQADVHGDCALSIAEECEDIAAAIQHVS